MVHFKTRPSKKERRKVYKKMLKLYKSDSEFNHIKHLWMGDSYFETSGLCTALIELCWIHKGEIDGDIKKYPELLEDRKFRKRMYFWKLDEEGYIQRVTLLLEAIKKTKQIN